MLPLQRAMRLIPGCGTKIRHAKLKHTHTHTHTHVATEVSVEGGVEKDVIHIYNGMLLKKCNNDICSNMSVDGPETVILSEVKRTRNVI